MNTVFIYRISDTFKKNLYLNLESENFCIIKLKLKYSFLKEIYNE